MRTAIVATCLLTTACASPARELESHLAITDSHLDRLSESLDALNAKISASAPSAPAKPAAGVTCRDGKLAEYAEGDLRPGEKALGKHQHCAPPRDYAWCIGERPFSDVADACAAGKLDALLAAEKKP